MKKVLGILLSLVMVLSFSFNDTRVKAEELLKETPKDPIEEATVAFDLTKNVAQEKVIYDEEGNYLGTLGVEPVNPEFTTFDSPIASGNNRFKVYWYTGVINLSYYINIYRNGLYSRITKVDSEWRLVSPPYVVESESLSITNPQESYQKAATARYRIYYSIAGIGGGIPYDLKSKVQAGWLYTSVSSFG